MIENEITIPMEEYKDLLIIKGKYEELKQNYQLLMYNKPLEKIPKYFDDNNITLYKLCQEKGVNGKVENHE